MSAYNLPPPPPPQICSNVRTLALCLISLAALIFAPQAVQAQIPAPNNLRLAQINSNNLVFAWDAVPEILFLVGIENERRGAPGTWDMLVVATYGSDGTTTTGTTDAAGRNLYVAGRTIKFRVRISAGLPVADSPWSELTVHAPPAAPTGLSAVPGGSRMTLSWTNPSSDSRIRPQAQIRPVGGSWPSSWTSTASAASHTFRGLTLDTEYEMRVRARNSADDPGPASASLTERTLATPDPEPEPERRGRRSSSRRSSPSYTPTPKPHVDTLRALPAEIEVNNWPHGAQGKRVRGAEIGVKALLDHGVVDAIDVWGYVGSGVEVCFQRFGTIVFLDAAYSPRRQSDLPGYQRNGMTCATIDRAGTVVLLRADAPLTKPTPKIRLSNCMVRLKYDLNFRATPAGDIIGVLPAFIRLTAFEHRGGWYFVDYHGRRGWVSARYVQPQGDCG